MHAVCYAVQQSQVILLQVPPGSKDWLEDKDLARLQRILYRKDKKKTVVLKEEIEMIDEKVEM